MVQRITVNPNIMSWAIQRAGHNVDAYFDEHPDEYAWYSQTKQPTSRQYEEFAKRLHVPYGFLFLNEPPHEEIPIPMFRGAAGDHRFNLNLYDTILSIQRRQDWLSDYLKDNDYDPCPCVGIIDLNTPVEKTVQLLRHYLGLNEDWAFDIQDSSKAVTHLSDRIEDLTISVTFNSGVENNNHREIPVEECRGFVLVDDIVPFIFINNRDSKTAQLFTLIHEMTHVLLGMSSGFGGEVDQIHDQTERYCDRVAAAFLVPSDLFLKTWNGIPNTAKKFKVSELVIARRAHDFRLISDEDYRAFYLDYLHRPLPQKKPGRGDFYKTALKRVGHLFAVHVNNAVTSRNLDYLQAYRLTGLYGKTYDAFVKSQIS